MKLPAFQNTKMFSPTPGERLTAHPAVVFALWFLVMMLAQLGRDLLYRIGIWLIPSSSLAVHTLLQLFATISTVAVVLLYCLIAEKRSLSTLGFRKRGALAEYGIGLLVGFLLFGGAVLVAFLCGAMTVQAAAVFPSLSTLSLYFIAFLIQGLSEELLCRSYLMVSLSRGWPLWVCVIANALLFSLLHLGNPGVSWIALTNIFLFGLFASLLTIRRGSIWMIAAIHSMWNFVQGNFFGIPVSGIAGSPSPLISIPAKDAFSTVINGGGFGLEAGLAVTVILIPACVIAGFLPTKQSEIENSSP